MTALAFGIFATIVTIFYGSPITAEVTPNPCGTYGTLVIYGTDVNLPLDYVEAYDTTEYFQAVVDAPSKGAYMDYSEDDGYPVAGIIADHKNQGFDVLYNLPIDTTSEIFYPDGSSQKYVLRERRRDGENDGFIKLDGTYIELLVPSDWICMYTCNPEGWWTITVTFWEPVTK